MGTTLEESLTMHDPTIQPIEPPLEGKGIVAWMNDRYICTY